MRPARFEELAVSLAKAAPDAGSVMPLAEAGDRQHPSGLAVKLAGREVRFQFVATSADGDKYSEPEVSVEGDPVTEAPAGGSPEEQWLTRLLAGSGSREIAGLEPWSAREGIESRQDGVTVRFYSGAKIFARVL